MTKKPEIDPFRFVSAIEQSELTIYDLIDVGHPTLWIPAIELEFLLDRGLRGLALDGLANRTRSKVIKQRICKVLGYPIPSSFKKTKPRFLGQQFDVYGQKHKNFQVWNEGLSASRRYVLIQISGIGIVTKVKVVTGDTLSWLDTTKTLTKKFQARCIPKSDPTELLVNSDTNLLAPFVNQAFDLRHGANPTSYPQNNEILPITTIFDRLSPLVGRRFPDAGRDQERNRGADLHRLVCSTLGYQSYQDIGRFPDVRHQLLEIKLQTSRTIDLGLICPNSFEPLDIPMIGGVQIRPCDVRYAIFYADISNSIVKLSHFMLTTGEAFFSRFPQFQGKILNSKLQMSLPFDFFET